MNQATAAVRSSCNFLASQQGQDGLWRDYALPPGASSEWTTGFVAYSLLRARAVFAAKESLDRAYAALRACCRPTGWGYNAKVATDADSTSWIVRLFAEGDVAAPLDAMACLERYLGPEGGARTFVAGARYGNWTHEHVDVSAVLGLAMKASKAPAQMLQRLRQWTLGKRNRDGLWTSFWWTFDAYATARVLEFLHETGGIPEDVADACRVYLGNRAVPASVMESADLITMALCVGVCPCRWVDSLLRSQMADGGWPPSRVLKVPDQRATPDGDAVFEDVNRLMSTAMAVMALAE